MNKYTENLFDAIKLTTESIISNLSFDKTINCSIVNIQDRSKRIYTVTDGVSNFTATGIEDYAIGDNVYVLIPQGDYNQQKTIVGKKQSEGNEESNNLLKPYDSIIPLFNHSLNDENVLIANSGNKELEIFSLNNLNAENYSLMGVSSIFNISNCENLSEQDKESYQEIIEGTYGIVINVTGISKTTDLNLQRNYIFNNDNFFGNSYLYLEEGNLQETAFDVSEFKTINSIKILFHQLDDFKYSYFDEEQEKDIIEELPNQIKKLSIKNINLILGNNINEYNNGDLIIQDSFNNLNYSLAPGENLQEKIITMNFLRSNSKNELYNNRQPLDLFNSTVPLYISKNNELITDINKLILIYQELEEKDTLDTKIETDEGIIDSNSSDEIAISPLRYSYFNYLMVRNLISFDWFKYKIDNSIKDNDILGEFWEKQTQQSNPFIFRFTPENEYREKIKTLIQFSGQVVLETFENQISNKIEPYSPLTEIDLTETISSLQRQYELEGYTCFTEFNKLSSENFVNDTIINLNPTDNKIKKREYLFIAVDGKDASGKYIPVAAVWLQTDLNEPIAIISNELVYYNSASQLEVQNSVNLIKDLSLECKDSENGYYYKYGADNTISASEATQNRILEAKFNIISSEGLKVNDPYIQWFIPSTNTMIEPPKDWSEENGWYQSPITQIVNRNLVLEEGEAIPPNSYSIGEKDEDIEITQSLNYQIKQVYAANANRNEIKCIIYINNNKNEIQKTLYFGPMSTNGTKYTFITSLGERYLNINQENENGSVSNVPNLNTSYPKVASFDFENNYWTKINFELYDSERNALNLSANSIQISLVNNNFKIKNGEDQENTYEFFETYFDKDENIFIRLKEKYDFEVFSQYSVYLQASLSQGNNTLTNIFPIPISKNIELYNQYNGVDKIIYNSYGNNASYYKSTHQICDKEQKPVDNLKWSVFIEGAISNANTNINYPEFKEDNTLSIPAMYLNNFYDNKRISIIAQNQNKNNEIIFIQPIIIMQNAYENALLNEWDEKLTIETEDGIILSTILGAGTKNNENKFSGILMGSIGYEEASQETGLFGYDKGVQSFGFKVDGTAFIGTATSGRISFDGNVGKIESQGFYESEQDLGESSGSSWDLTESVFKLYGSTIDSNQSNTGATTKILLDTKGNNLNNDYFSLYTTLNITKEDSTTIEINEPLDTETILVPLLACRKGKDNEKGEFFLQSANLGDLKILNKIDDYFNKFKEDSDDTPYLKLDIANGIIYAYTGLLGSWFLNPNQLMSEFDYIGTSAFSDIENLNTSIELNTNRNAENIKISEEDLFITKELTKAIAKNDISWVEPKKIIKKKNIDLIHLTSNTQIINYYKDKNINNYYTINNDMFSLQVENNDEIVHTFEYKLVSYTHEEINEATGEVIQTTIKKPTWYYKIPSNDNTGSNEIIEDVLLSNFGIEFFVSGNTTQDNEKIIETFGENIVIENNEIIEATLNIQKYNININFETFQDNFSNIILDGKWNLEIIQNENEASYNATLKIDNNSIQSQIKIENNNFYGINLSFLSSNTFKKLILQFEVETDPEEQNQLQILGSYTIDDILNSTLVNIQGVVNEISLQFLDSEHISILNNLNEYIYSQDFAYDTENHRTILNFQIQIPETGVNKVLKYFPLSVDFDFDCTIFYDVKFTATTDKDNTDNTPFIDDDITKYNIKNICNNFSNVTSDDEIKYFNELVELFKRKNDNLIESICNNPYFSGATSMTLTENNDNLYENTIKLHRAGGIAFELDELYRRAGSFNSELLPVISIVFKNPPSGTLYNLEHILLHGDYHEGILTTDWILTDTALQMRVQTDETTHIWNFTSKGSISRLGIEGVQWRTGRDYALISVSSNGGTLYNPIISGKTPTGTWDIGTYTKDTLHFSFVADTDYNNNVNDRKMGIVFSNTDLSVNPIRTNNVILGTSTYRWKNIYSISANFISSVYLTKNDHGFVIQSENSKYALGLHMGGGINRGLYDHKKTNGLGQWVFYLNSNNNVLIQANNEILLRALNSNILTVTFSPRYYRGGTSYSAASFLKVYNHRNGDGNDLILAAGNAMIIGSGDNILNFYNGLGQSNSKSQEHLYFISDSQIYFYVNNNNKSPVRALYLSSTGTVDFINNVTLTKNTRYFAVSIPSESNLSTKPTKTYKIGFGNGSSAVYRGIYDEAGSYGGLGAWAVSLDNNNYLCLNGNNYVLPGAAGATKNGTLNFGSSYFRWASIYSVAGNFSGKLSADNLETTNGAIVHGTASINTLKVTAPNGTTGGVNAHFYPSTDNTYNLGSSNYRWNTGHFSDAIRIYTSADRAGWGKTSEELGAITIGPNGDTQMRIDQNEIVVVSGSSAALTELYLQASVVRVRGALQPNDASDNTNRTIGTDGLQWNSIYAKSIFQNKSQVTSDKRLKEIQNNDLLEKDLQVYDNLTPVVFKYKNIFADDNHDRNHIGFIAQDVEQVIKNQGMTNVECALISAVPVDHDLDIFTDGKKYYLGLEELHGLHVLKNQRQDAEIKELKTKIKSLEEKISELEIMLI